MPEESIGEGCKCIYPFMKHYLLIALDEMIDKKKKEIKDVEERVEAIRKTGLAESEELKKAHEKFMEGLTQLRSWQSVLETVRRRVSAMPECE
jgi:hypothetical protein